MQSKGQMSTTEQVIFALVFTIFILGILLVKLDFSMRGKVQPEILSITASSALNALSGMEKGKVTINLDKAWDITLARDSIKFEEGKRKGEAGILGNVKEARISGAEKIQIIKEIGKPAEIIKLEK